VEERCLLAGVFRIKSKQASKFQKKKEVFPVEDRKALKEKALRDVWSEEHAMKLRKYLASRLGETSLREMASRLGVSGGHLSRVLSGKSSLAPAMLIRIARALGEEPESVLAAAGIGGGKTVEAFGKEDKKTVTLSLDDGLFTLRKQLCSMDSAKFVHFKTNLCVFLLAARRADMFTVLGLQAALDNPKTAAQYMIMASDDTKKIALHALAFTMFPLEYAVEGGLEFKAFSSFFASLSFAAYLPRRFLQMVAKDKIVRRESESSVSTGRDEAESSGAEGPEAEGAG
jgi:transcriptional regulator with XRE-family HTH domain